MTDHTARTAAIYDALVAFQNTHRLPGLQHAQIRGLLAEHLARALPVSSAGHAPATDQAAAPTDWIDGHPQLEAIAAAVWEQCGRSDSGICVEDDPRNIAVAALAAVLPATTDRATVLREAYEQLRQVPHTHVLTELRRLAAEAGPADTTRQDDGATTGCAQCGHLACMGKGRRCGVVLTSEAGVVKPPCQCLGAEQPAAAQQPKEADGDRIVAYRSPLPGALSLYCTSHPDELGDGVMPLTSDDLPDGGLCAACGVDVLIPQQPKEA